MGVNMTLNDRIEYLSYVFDSLQDTNSLVEKRAIVEGIDEECREDFNYILEVLAGKHPFGYTYYQITYVPDLRISLNSTVKEVLEFLQIPKLTGNLSVSNIYSYTQSTMNYYWFFEAIVNRTLRLGICSSLLLNDELSPMLAKKYEGSVPSSTSGYYVTEKLDGNRCIAHYSYEDNKWIFTSRSGRLMNVDFDMTGLTTNFIYDGEILSPEQTERSECIKNYCIKHTDLPDEFDRSKAFSNTSGLINRHTLNKILIYNIFDIVIDIPYSGRRKLLTRLSLLPHSKSIRILPVLNYYQKSTELNDNIMPLLDAVTSMGAEGLMINNGDSSYKHKRTDSLLKFKKVKTMDMKVTEINYGTGKYENLIGAIIAECITEDGKKVSCSVGTGLSDFQRVSWSAHPEQIIGKIIEVAYFDLSRRKDAEYNEYSLRFPRLKSLRNDKSEVSEY